VIPASSGLEAALCRIFAQVLMLDEVTIDQDFYDLGGNSLLAGEIAGRARADLGLELTVGEILEQGSIAAITAVTAHSIPRASMGLDLEIPTRPSPTVPLPVSYPQRSLWLLDQLEGPSPRYNEALVARLSGELRPGALRLALGDVVARHEVLRTRLGLADDGPVQRVVPAREAAALVVMDERDTTAEALGLELRSAARQTFDLAWDLPIRAWLFRLSRDTHALLVVVHHVAFDGASIGPLWRDLACAYNARIHGFGPQWNPLPVQYRDFTLWQRHILDGDAAGGVGAGTTTGAGDYAVDHRDAMGAVARHASFWLEQLAGLASLMPVATDRPRPPVRSPEGRRVPVEIDATLHQRIGALARSRHTTVFSVIHAAVAYALWRRGAGDDVVLGTVVAGRGDLALTDLIGFFANTIVLRVDASGATGTIDLLGRAHEANVRALAHQDLPFERVVELVNPSRSLAHHPLVQVFLAFQVGRLDPPYFEGLDLEFQPLDFGITKFDLCFDMGEVFKPLGLPAGIVGWVDYAIDIFDESTVVALRDEFVAALVAAVACDSVPGPEGCAAHALG
jgi:Condensation domain/Phosphopantetheine attachment site